MIFLAKVIIHYKKNGWDLPAASVFTLFPRRAWERVRMTLLKQCRVDPQMGENTRRIT